MTARSDLAALIQRVEAAEGPSRELDAEIACFLRGYTIHADTDPKAGWFAYWLGEPEGSECVNCREWPAYTASLDAAASLVPSGCLYMARTLWDGGGETASGCATVTQYSAAPDRMWVWDYSGNAATPALALCAAALRARQAMEARDE